MTRPGLVLRVDGRTPPLAVPAGESLRTLRLPAGSDVVYPPEPLPVLSDPLAEVAAALSGPVDSPPLAALLRPGMRLTVAVDGVGTPWPMTAPPNPRGRIVEAVLTLAARADVDDVVVVVASGLGRRPTAFETAALLGERVSRSFGPLGRLLDHDPDARDVVRVGETADGVPVQLSARVASSDLLVRVGVVTAAGESGPAAVPRTLGSTATVLACEDPATARHAGALAAAAVPTFAVEVVLADVPDGDRAGFLARREWEWSVRDQLAAGATRVLFPRLPRRVRDGAVAAVHGGRGLVAITAGEPGAVAARTRAVLDRQHRVDVPGQADVVVLGVPAVGPHNAGAPLNPVLAASLALDTLLGAHTGHPVVRRGGVAVLLHPLAPRFSQAQHGPHADFYAEVLPAGLDDAGWAAAQRRYAADPWYRQRARDGHAYPGVHPFLLWRRTQAMRDHLGDVVWVGADRTAAARVGGRAATTVADALEIASAAVGRDPSVRLLHSPPRLLADVAPCDPGPERPA